MKKLFYLIIVEVFFCQIIAGQSTKDSLNYELGEVEINDKNENNGNGLLRLKAVEGAEIYSSKKSEVILLKQIDANLATNNSRQVFAKIPGITIFESDPVGAQLGIAARGLNPNRSVDFNTRQNGIDMSADALGYPESYYLPPLDAVEKIRIVRGAASLQYGTQFGGMIDFVINKGPKNKKLEITSKNNIAQYGLYTHFTSIGGQVGKLNYYSFYSYKVGNGWRPNTQFDIHTGYVGLKYDFSEKFSVSFNATLMRYLMQQPGGLTDSKYLQNPQQSIRDRNWFAVNWNLFSLNADYKINERNKINLRSFGFVGDRLALGYLERIDRADVSNQNRNFINDHYINFGAELRYLRNYNLLSKISTFVVGTRFYQGNTSKKQGFGSNGKDANFKFNEPNFLQGDFKFPGRNIALFAENIFNFSERFSITPGMRWEYIATNSKGYYTNTHFNMFDSTKYSESRSFIRQFPIFGIGSSFIPLSGTEIYANISQNFKGITFTDMRVVNPNALIDPNLKDERGYNFDFGYRGEIKNYINFDINFFYLVYNNRIGFILVNNPATLNTIRYTTNIGKSQSIGFEYYTDFNITNILKLNKKFGQLSFYQSGNILDARYVSSQKSNIDGRFVEYAPALTYRCGIQYKIKKISFTYQYAYTSQQFSDATNSLVSSQDATIGIIPAYYVMDFSANYQYRFLTFSGGVNNLTNNMYFTRRAISYPGPGIIPAEPRIFYFSIGIKI